MRWQGATQIQAGFTNRPLKPTIIGSWRSEARQAWLKTKLHNNLAGQAISWRPRFVDIDEAAACQSHHIDNASPSLHWRAFAELQRRPCRIDHGGVDLLPRWPCVNAEGAWIGVVFDNSRPVGAERDGANLLNETALARRP